MGPILQEQMLALDLTATIKKKHVFLLSFDLAILNKEHVKRS